MKIQTIEENGTFPGVGDTGEWANATTYHEIDIAVDQKHCNDSSMIDEKRKSTLPKKPQHTAALNSHEAIRTADMETFWSQHTDDARNVRRNCKVYSGVAFLLCAGLNASLLLKRISPATFGGVSVCLSLSLGAIGLLLVTIFATEFIFGQCDKSRRVSIKMPCCRPECCGMKQRLTSFHAPTLLFFLCNAGIATSLIKTKTKTRHFGLAVWCFVFETMVWALLAVLAELVFDRVTFKNTRVKSTSPPDVERKEATEEVKELELVIHRGNSPSEIEAGPTAGQIEIKGLFFNFNPLRPSQAKKVRFESSSTPM